MNDSIHFNETEAYVIYCEDTAPSDLMNSAYLMPYEIQRLSQNKLVAKTEDFRQLIKKFYRLE